MINESLLKRNKRKEIIWFFKHFDVTLHPKQDNSHEKVIIFIISCYHIHLFLLLRKENRGKEDYHWYYSYDGNADTKMQQTLHDRNTCP